MKQFLLMTGACALVLAACDSPPERELDQAPAGDTVEQTQDAGDGFGEDTDGLDGAMDGAGDEFDAAMEPADTAPDGLIEGLSALCGQSFAGSITSADDPRDESFAGRDLVMHVRECMDDEVRVPFHVGDNHSRTWLITRLEDGRLRLKHDHRMEDGSEDVLTQYGGETEAPPTGARADFVVDTFSQELFVREEIPESATNVWIMELTDTAFYYRLTRENRFFEVTFDLTQPVDTPPTPWGWED